MRFVMRNVVGFIFESRRGGWFGLVCVYVCLMVGSSFGWLVVDEVNRIGNDRDRK